MSTPATTLEQFEQYHHLCGFSLTTARRRTSTLRQFGRFIAPLSLGEATKRQVEEFLGSKGSARTRHAYRSDLRVFYDWAVDRQIVAADPSAKVHSIKVPKTLPRPIDRDTASAALCWGELKTRQMVAIALFAGLRCHEIAGLCAEDVWTQGAAPTIVVRAGKGGKDRVVPLHPVLLRLLAPLPPSGPLFPGRTGPGSTLRPASVSTTIKRHLSASGIDGTPHQLRHTFGTELARVSGGNMVYTAALMGHETMTTTMGYVRLANAPGGSIVNLMYDDDAA